MEGFWWGFFEEFKKQLASLTGLGSLRGLYTQSVTRPNGPTCSLMSTVSMVRAPKQGSSFHPTMKVATTLLVVHPNYTYLGQTLGKLKEEGKLDVTQSNVQTGPVI